LIELRKIHFAKGFKNSIKAPPTHCMRCTPLIVLLLKCMFFRLRKKNFVTPRGFAYAIAQSG
jgi:hypothetical protein